MPDEVTAEQAERAVKTLLDWAGVYPSESEAADHLDLANTPRRIAEMYREVFSSYREGALERLREGFTTFDIETSNMVVQRDIHFHSMCAHHCVPFFGTVAIGYLPGKKLAGLSKLARVVEFYSHRVQLQERMTDQIADFLESELRPRYVAVMVQAEHFCMSMRGVRKPGTSSLTFAERGDPTKASELFDRMLRSAP